MGARRITCLLELPESTDTDFSGHEGGREMMNTIAHRHAHARATMARQGNANQPSVPPMDVDRVLAMLEPKWLEHPDFHDGWSCMRARAVPFVAAQDRRGARILVTEGDASRLQRILSESTDDMDDRDLAALRAELDRAEIVKAHAVPPHVITMNSYVVCRDDRGTRSELRLTYPTDRRRDDRSVSVLTPIGTALLGVSVGALLELSSDRALRVTSLAYQPERAGHFES